MNTAHDLLQQARAAGYILTPKEGGLIGGGTGRVLG